MKRILLLMITAIMLTACTNEKVDVPEVEVPKKEVITAVISEQEHDIVLFDNEDLKMTLLKSTHERYENSDTKDRIELDVRVENKRNRTFNFYIKELNLDGVETNDMRTLFDETEIEPNETKEVVLITYTKTYIDEFDLEFKEHLSGRINYSDHERSRLQTSFSEYIIEQ